MPKPPAITVTALLLVAGAVPAAPPGAVTPPDRLADRQRFEDSLVVREVEVRFDLEVLPPFESLGKRGAGDFVLVEEGAERPTLRFEAEPEAGGWEVLLWFDAGLASGPARAVAARALAERAATLAAAGSVELIEAGAALARSGPIGSAAALSAQLLDVAGRAAGEAPTVPRVAESLDRLAVEIAERKGGGARALLLPMSSLEVDAQFLDELGRARAGEPATPRVRPLVEAARTLAGYGWTTFAIALPADAEPVALRAGDAPATVTQGPSGDVRVSAPIERPRPAATDSTRLDTALDLGLIPSGDLVRASSGAVAGQPAFLDTLLDRLFSRARLVAMAPEAPPGRLLARQVLWSGGDGRPLPAVTLARASTPAEVAAARLRRALAGAAGGALGGGVGIDRSDGGIRVCLAAGVERAWIRLSSARRVEGSAVLAIGEPTDLRRPGAKGAAAGEAAPACVAWPAATLRDPVHLVEDLDRETWTSF